MKSPRFTAAARGNETAPFCCKSRANAPHDFLVCGGIDQAGLKDLNENRLSKFELGLFITKTMEVQRRGREPKRRSFSSSVSQFAPGLFVTKTMAVQRRGREGGLAAREWEMERA